MTRQFPIEQSWRKRLRIAWFRFRCMRDDQERRILRRQIVDAAFELGVPDAIPPHWNRDGTLRP
jgi:hypothetical protein